MSCVADTGSIKLPRYYAISCRVVKKEVFKIKNRNFTLWEPMRSVVAPNFGVWDLPNLNDTKEIDMDQLIRTIQSVSTVEIKPNKLDWKVVVLIIVGVIVGLLLIISFIMFYYYKHFGNILCFEGGQVGKRVPISDHTVSAPDKGDDGVNVASDENKKKDPAIPSFCLDANI